jgi:hypothetical protein
MREQPSPPPGPRSALQRREASDSRPRPQSEEVRCTCHSLLARVVKGCLELKCRRCRHVLLVELSRLSSAGHAIELRLHRAGGQGAEVLHVADSRQGQKEGSG